MITKAVRESPGWAGRDSTTKSANTLSQHKDKRGRFLRIGILYLLHTRALGTSYPVWAGREHYFSANSIFMTSTAEKYHFSACPILALRCQQLHVHTITHHQQSNNLPCRGYSTWPKYSQLDDTSALCRSRWKKQILNALLNVAGYGLTVPTTVSLQKSLRNACCCCGCGTP